MRVDVTYYLSGTASSAMDVSGQFKYLVSALGNRGFKLSSTFPTKHLICINHNPKAYKEFVRFGGKPENASLICLEPYAVYPSQYSAKVFELYAVIHSPGNPTFKDSSGQFIPWPYEATANPLKPYDDGLSLRSHVEENALKGVFSYDNWINRKDFVTLINANKVSPVKNENYGLRRVYARDLPENLLAVYGDLWVSSISKKIVHRLMVLLFTLKSGHLPRILNIYGNLHWKFKSARGPLEDKQITLQSSKFSIIIENDSSYISEKLIDALINGCVPIYFGPKNIDSIIPKGTYLELSKTPDELIPMLENLSETEIRNLLSNIQMFVTSEEFTLRWDKKNVFTQLASSIDNQIRAIHE
jgi:hypothetical protein